VLVLGSGKDNIAVSIVFNLGQSPFLSRFSIGAWRLEGSVYMSLQQDWSHIVDSELSKIRVRWWMGKGILSSRGIKSSSWVDESLQFRRVVR
jgi:hypothetical protein